MLNEYFYKKSISPRNLDELLARGWRHFGEYFFRYDTSFIEENFQLVKVKVLPLRICLPTFTFNKRQRKILRQNAIFTVKRQIIQIIEYKHTLFQKHALRFQRETRPRSLFDFISRLPHKVPLPTFEIEVWDKEKLIANSFIDITENSFSSIYAMFDTDYAKYSLGIFTLLQEILWAKELDKQYLYLGYAYDRPSFYDYKKRFNALEYYEWTENQWKTFIQNE